MALKMVGQMVRVRSGKTSGARHMVPARLIDVGKKQARVRPVGHGHDEEWVKFSQLYTWKKGNQPRH